METQLRKMNNLDTKLTDENETESHDDKEARDLMRALQSECSTLSDYENKKNADLQKYILNSLSIFANISYRDNYNKLLDRNIFGNIIMADKIWEILREKHYNEADIDEILHEVNRLPHKSDNTPTT